MQGEVKRASSGDKWVPKAGTLGVGEGRDQGDKAGWGTAMTQSTEGLESSLIKASGLYL